MPYTKVEAERISHEVSRLIAEGRDKTLIWHDLDEDRSKWNDFLTSLDNGDGVSLATGKKFTRSQKEGFEILCEAIEVGRSMMDKMFAGWARAQLMKPAGTIPKAAIDFTLLRMGDGIKDLGNLDQAIIDEELAKYDV